MDLQERLQAVQALHQELVQVIDAGERQIEEVEREREASIRRYQEARATAELRKSFLEGQMTLLSEMMQAEALRQTQESFPTDVDMRPGADEIGDWTDAAGFEHLNDSALSPASRPVNSTLEGIIRLPQEKSLPMLNGTQDNSQPN